MKRLLPASLFGRMMLVLSSGLILAQLLSASINFAERDRAVLRNSGMQSAQRIADVVKLLDSMPHQERLRIAKVLSVPPQVVDLEPSPIKTTAAAMRSAQTMMFSQALHSALGDERPLIVSASANPSDANGFSDMHRRPLPGMASMAAYMSGMTQASRSSMQAFMAEKLGFLIQVQLHDGSWVAFTTQLHQGTHTPPWHLLLTLLVLLASVLFLSFVAVRWMTRPLAVLASAAESLGEDIHRPPLPEAGPAEVRRAAHAFNTMQA